MLFYLLFLYYRTRNSFFFFFIRIRLYIVRNELLYDYGVCIIESEKKNAYKPERARDFNENALDAKKFMGKKSYKIIIR